MLQYKHLEDNYPVGAINKIDDNTIVSSKLDRSYANYAQFNNLIDAFEHSNVESGIIGGKVICTIDLPDNIVFYG